MLCILLTCFVFSAVFGKSLPQNNSALLISKYAKVAHWGNQNASEGRSNSGQSLWAHSSDVKVVKGQNLKRPSVVYHYASPKKDDRKTEIIPGIGEVIQERFNPKPYFKYEQVPPNSDDNGYSYNPPSSDSNAAPSPTFDSIQTKPSVDASSPTSDSNLKPPSDLYSSPFSSYNPPSDVKSNDDQVGPIYPPNSGSPSKDQPPSNNNSNKQPSKPSFVSYNTPVASPDDDVFYPPDDHHESIMDHPPFDHKPEEILDHPPYEHKPADMAEEDLSPPPSSDVQDDPRFPSYLYDHHPYDFDHHDHHVYHEVTTTTQKAMEDQRVSGGHYSYYYLGRKLWYIPLYFSVYFIIYVTVLILKSIARHKIQFKQYFADDNRKARSMDEANVDEIHKNVDSAISNAKIKYMAM